MKLRWATTLRTKTRTTNLFVERLEYRRLMSASPNRVDLPSSARLDAFVQDLNQRRGDRGREQSDRFGENRGDENRGDKDRGDKDRNLREQVEKQSRFEPQKRLVGRSAGTTVGQRQSPNHKFSYKTSVPAQYSNPRRIDEFPQFNSATMSAAESVEVPEQLVSELLTPPRRSQTLASVLSADTTLDLVGPQDLRPRPPSVVFQSRFVPPTSVMPASVAVPSIAAATRVTPSVSVAATNEAIPIVSRSGSDGVFPMAAQPFLVLGAGDDEDELPQEVVEMTMPLELGGAIDLNRLPKLIDTLPVIVDETTTLFNLGDIKDTDDEEDQSDEGEETRRKRAETTTKANQSAPSIQGQSTTNTNMHPTSKAPDASTDCIFANDQEDELFGGVIDMPESLVVSEELNAESLFDSIVPNAPRIDQIMSQAPMMEVGAEAQDSTQATEPEPLSINIQAGVPAAILVVPVLAIQQKQIDDARKQKQRKECRYHLPFDSTKKGG